MSRIRLRATVSSLTLAAALSGAAAADSPAPIWERRIAVAEDSSFGYPSVGRLLADGSFAVVFSEVEVSVARFDPDGTFRGAVGLGQWERLVTAIDPCGQVFVAVPTTSSPPGVWLMKFDGAAGRPVWPAGFLWSDASGADVAPISLDLDGRGDALLTFVRGSDRIVVKLSGERGEVLWTSQAVTGGTDTSTAAAIDTRGNLFLAAPDAAAGDADTIAWALDGRTGKRLWGPRSFALVPGAAEAPSHAEADGRGGLVIAGSAGDAAFAARLGAADGELLWGPSLRKTGNVVTTPTALALSGNAVYVAGTERSDDTRLFVDCFDLDSGQQCGNAFTLTHATGLLALSPAPDGDVFLTASFDGVNADVVGPVGSARIGRDGVVRWGVLYSVGVRGLFDNFPDAHGDLIEVVRTSEADSLLVRRSAHDGVSTPWTTFRGVRALANPREAIPLASGGLVLGYEHQSPNGGFVTLERLDRESGATRWKRTFSLSSSAAWTIATDDLDNVVLSRSQSFEGLLDKIGGESGETVWGSVTVGGTTDLVSVDRSGDIVVLRRQPMSLSTIEKRSGTTGGVLWGPSFTGHSSVSAIVFDAAGDIYLAGRNGNGTAANRSVSKVRSSNGTGVWITVPFDGSGLFDEAQRLAILPGGDLVVGGILESSPGQHRSFVSSYKADSGSLAWGPVDLGPAADRIPGEIETIVGAGDDVFVAVRTNAAGDLSLTSLRGSDGGLQWGPQPAGPSLTGPGRSLAIDDDGNPALAWTASDDEVHRDVRVAVFSRETGTILHGPIEIGGVSNDDVQSLHFGGDAWTLVATSRMPESPLPVTRVVSFDLGLGMTASPDGLLATCGTRFSHLLAAENAEGAVVWSIDSGELPRGLALSPDGRISGIPTETGQFSVRVRVEDSSGAKAIRPLDLFVRSRCLPASRSALAFCPSRVPAPVPTR